VDAIVSGSHGDVPFLIYGPPGTGKTKTVIEAILQLIPKDEVHILAVAPSPSAADTIALRLVPHLKPGQMYRINDITRTFAEVPTDLMLFCQSAESYFSFPPWEKLMAAKVVVTDCMGAFELIKARCTNQDIAPVREMFGKAFGKDITHWHWTHLFIDEAAQAREPETLIPLMVVAPGKMKNIPVPKLILAGDSNQLGPSIVSPIARENGIDVSLFDRLLRRPIYSQHPLSRQNVYKRSKGEGWYRPAFVNLIRNYRSHPGILMMPSAMFYNSTLLAEAKETSSLTTWTTLPNNRIPILFHPSTGEEFWILDTAGWYNKSEIEITTKLITHLVDRKNTPGTEVYAKEIAVIAPFREHVLRMRTALRKLGLHAVDVGTVENYQGGERRVTILNCVRSSYRFLEWDRKKGYGVIGEKRRFNVAITRAKELLIIVGNPTILQVLSSVTNLIVDG
jgi:superfamily I DNA and/or RNA helicase